MKTKKETTYNYAVPLQEMKRMYLSQTAGLDAVKSTVRALFSSASLIVSILGALQVFSARVSHDWTSTYWTLLFIIGLLYIAFIVVCVSCLLPVYVYPPFDDDWSTLTKTFQNMNEEQESAMYLSALLQAIRLNTPIVQRYVKRANTALILLPIIVILTLSLALIPRV